MYSSDILICHKKHITKHDILSIALYVFHDMNHILVSEMKYK